MKAILQKDGFLWFSHGNLGADLSWIMAVTFTLIFIVSWYQARQKKGNAHHTIILWGMLSMISYFLVYYISRQLGALALEAEGKAGFGGSDFVYHWVFSPLLTIHIVIVSIGLVLAFYMIPLGFRASRMENGQRILVPGAPRGATGKIIRNTWIIAFLLGLLLPVLRGFASTHSVRLFVDWIVVCLVIGGLVVLFEWLGAKKYPDGEVRHRKIGTLTMYCYVTALLTSTMTYFMLYVIWPSLPPE